MYMMITRFSAIAMTAFLSCMANAQNTDSSSTPAQNTPPLVPATWAFNPGKDTFSPDALLDLRSLNEDVAGASGYVHVADASGQLVLGDGRPARFWAVNTDIGRDKVFKPTPLGTKEAPSLARHARFLAKRGVNMVRLFGFVNPTATQSLDQTQDDVIDWMQRSVAAMKKEGIYSTLTPYWSVAAKSGPAWGLDDNGGSGVFSLLFFDPKLQAAYKGSVEENPDQPESVYRDSSRSGPGGCHSPTPKRRQPSLVDDGDD